MESLLSRSALLMVLQLLSTATGDDKNSDANGIVDGVPGDVAELLLPLLLLSLFVSVLFA